MVFLNKFLNVYDPVIDHHFAGEGGKGERGGGGGSQSGSFCKQRLTAANFGGKYSVLKLKVKICMKALPENKLKRSFSGEVSREFWCRLLCNFQQTLSFSQASVNGSYDIFHCLLS